MNWNISKADAEVLSVSRKRKIREQAALVGALTVRLVACDIRQAKEVQEVLLKEQKRLLELTEEK